MGIIAPELKIVFDAANKDHKGSELSLLSLPSDSKYRSRNARFASANHGMTDPHRKRRGPITLFCESRWFRAGVFAIVLAPVLYVTSFGPACWIAAVPTGRRPLAIPIWRRAYQPLCYFCNRYDGSLCSEAILHWADFWIPSGSMAVFPMTQERVWVIAD